MRSVLPALALFVLLAAEARAQCGEGEWLARAPTRRQGGPMAYDEARGVLVLHGGLTGTHVTTRVTDTWTWDGEDWEQVAASGPGRGRMVYDAARQRLVLFDSGVTWVWHGAQWETLAGAGSPPTGAAGSIGFAYDSGRGRVVMHISARFGECCASTWELIDDQWVKVSEGGPDQRHGAVMAYDASRQRMVLGGGSDGARYDPPEEIFYTDTWEYDSVEWTQVSEGGDVHPAGSRYSMVYDAASQMALLYGGYSYFELMGGIVTYYNGVIGWDGATWQVMGLDFPDRYGFSTTYHPGIGGPVIFGGLNIATGTSGDDRLLFGDLMERTAGEWRQTTPRDHHGAEHFGIIFDENRGRVVAFGGRTPVRESGGGYPMNHMGEWTGDRLNPVASPLAPPARSHLALAFDGAREELVLFGG
jgi:hypothetical protein